MRKSLKSLCALLSLSAASCSSQRETPSIVSVGLMTGDEYAITPEFVVHYNGNAFSLLQEDAPPLIPTAIRDEWKSKPFGEWSEEARKETFILQRYQIKQMQKTLIKKVIDKEKRYLAVITDLDPSNQTLASLFPRGIPEINLSGYEPPIAPEDVDALAILDTRAIKDTKAYEKILGMGGYELDRFVLSNQLEEGNWLVYFTGKATKKVQKDPVFKFRAETLFPYPSRHRKATQSQEKAIMEGHLEELLP